MDYLELANELIDIQTLLLQVSEMQQLSTIVRGELSVLNYLLHHGTNVHPKELSERMAVSSARIAALLKRLEEKKMIQRQVDPLDKRQIVIILTDLGRQEILRVRADLMSILAAMLEKLGRENAAAFIRIQQQIYDAAQSKR